MDSGSTLTSASQFAKYREGTCQNRTLHIISRKRLLDAGKKHGRLAPQLDSWFRTAKAAKWRSLEEVRRTYSSADGVPAGDTVYTVFNILGTGFRLITEIYYEDQTILVRHVLTHADYDKGDWKK